MTSFERKIIASRQISVVPYEAVVANPLSAAAEAVEWCRDFDKVLVHFDVDIIDFADFPIAENTRRHFGMTFEVAMSAFSAVMEAPNIAACTVTEINPLHSDAGGKLIDKFAICLAEILAKMSRIKL